MKLSLLYKYLAIYVLIGIIGFLAVTYISYSIEYSDVEKHFSNQLYAQANAIADEYASDTFNSEHMRVIERQLGIIAKLNDTRILFIDTVGNVILDTSFKKNNSDEELILYTVDDFDYGKLGGKHSIIDNFYGVFDSPTLSVFYPITNSFTTKGYVVINIPESVITQRVYVTFNTNYFTFTVIMLLTFVFIIVFTLSIHKPVNELIHATDEYGKGNLAYHIKIKNNDEIGRLGMSLEYMASRLNEIDVFQQKFLSNISHDFRSPLTSIKGYLEAMQDGTIPPELYEKYIDIVLFETERLTKLTGNILTLNELDPKTVHLDIISFDINSIIKHTIETLEGNCKKKNIKFVLEFPADSEYIVADKGKIQQVIYNLIDNAIKFSKDNSIISITIKEKIEKIYVSVKDTGSGISKDDIDKIWDRFYKSDSSRGRDKKGSGLGLSITKEIIQAHNETIDVISTPNVGTEFIFTLTRDKTKM